MSVKDDNNKKSSKNVKKVQKKGRPSVIPEEKEEEYKDPLKNVKKNKELQAWLHKLENMHTILTAEDDCCK